MYKLSLFLFTGSSTDFDQVLFPLLCGQVVSDFSNFIIKNKKGINKPAIENKSPAILNILSVKPWFKASLCQGEFQCSPFLGTLLTPSKSLKLRTMC